MNLNDEAIKPPKQDPKAGCRCPFEKKLLRDYLQIYQDNNRSPMHDWYNIGYIWISELISYIDHIVILIPNRFLSECDMLRSYVVF
jgi:hypothetical protein